MNDWNTPPSEQKSSFLQRIDPAQWKLFFLVLVMGCAGGVYFFLGYTDLRDSAALYVGLPTFLALALSLTPRTKSPISATMKGITIALLLAAPVFNEGYICILFAAPIFYFFGVLIALAVQSYRDSGRKFHTAMAATVLAVMALEGTTDITSFPRDHVVSVTKIVPASVSDIRHTLAKPPVLGKDKPLFLTIFPYPTRMTGQGLQPGATRTTHFVAYKHIFWNKVEGDAVFKVTEASDRKIVFNLQSDDSYVGHYVGWQQSQIDLQPLTAHSTKVTWTLSFHRKYDPAWYFGTLQRYAVGLVAEELIDHAATPNT